MLNLVNKTMYGLFDRVEVSKCLSCYECIDSLHSHSINMELVPPFAAITVSTLLGRLTTRCWNIAAGTCFHSATRALARSGTDGRLGD